MHDSRARSVLRLADRLFSDKRQVDSLWQEIALNFYPERADFTVSRTEGAEFSDHLFSSYPVMARRELANVLAEFLRPDKFFSIHVNDEGLDESDEERAFLERLTNIQWRAMSDPVARLVTAASQTDHDIAAFGNAVLWYGLNVEGDSLLFRNYHLRDCAWTENAHGVIDCIYRKWKPTARQLERHFPKTIPTCVKKALADGPNKDPDKPFDCFHVVMPSRLYDYKTKGGKVFPYVSLYIICEGETLLEETGLSHFPYVVPRWQTVSGSVYGTSMATAAILPDGRTLQVVMRTLREAGEMHVNPPMIGVTEAIRGDIALYPGGITFADMEYDAKLGDVLRPITRDKSGYPIGREIVESLKQDIRQGFMLDKIQLPETTRAMTATEVRRRVQEHIRAAAPISKPIQQEYNYPLCDGVFNLLMAHDAFPREEMPDSLRDKEIKFKFRSPLDDLADQNEAEVFLDVRDRIFAPAIQLDPSLADLVDWATATRDAARSAGFKAKWLKPVQDVGKRRQEMAEEQEAAQTVQDLATAGQIAEQGGKGLGALVQGANMAMQPPGVPPGSPNGPAPQPLPMPGTRQPLAPVPVR
jgi:hypothetical protein